MAAKAYDLKNLGRPRKTEIYVTARAANYKADLLIKDLKILAKTAYLKQDGDLNRRIGELEVLKMWLKGVHDIMLKMED